VYDGNHYFHVQPRHTKSALPLERTVDLSDGVIALRSSLMATPMPANRCIDAPRGGGQMEAWSAGGCIPGRPFLVGSSRRHFSATVQMRAFVFDTLSRNLGRIGIDFSRSTALSWSSSMLVGPFKGRPYSTKGYHFQRRGRTRTRNSTISAPKLCRKEFSLLQLFLFGLDRESRLCRPKGDR
jgi:hypothetical protein